MESRKPEYGIVFIILMVLFSIILSRMPMGLFVFPLPVLLAASGIRRTADAVRAHLFSTAGVIGLYLITSYSLFTAEFISIALLGLVFPLTVSVGCTLWIRLREYSNSVLRKLVICSVPSAVIALAFSVWLCLPSSSGSVENLRAAYSMVIPQDLVGDGVDIVGIFIAFLKVGSVPVAMIFQGIPILLSEVLIHRRDENWNFEFANMKMPYKYVWVFIGLLALSIIIPRLGFSSQIPVVIVWNLALGMSLHYLMDGVSVLTAVLRKRYLTFTPGRVMFWLLLMLIVPGVNMFVVTVLLSAGVFENWVKLR